jgi:FHS family L-fucose permease-like MFS transporter
LNNYDYRTNKVNNSALYTLITVFFGIHWCINGIFIPFVKLNLLRSISKSLIDFFYGAYYIGNFTFIFSSLAKKDILNAWGFKKGIIYGIQ